MPILIAISIILLTVGVFLAMQALYKRYEKPYLLPMLTTTIVIIIVLLIADIPYDTYMIGGDWIQQLLGPAVVALAVPLYNQRDLIIKYKFSILCSVTIAMIGGLVSVFLLFKLLKLQSTYILTALPKSLTSPVAMQISDQIGGIAPLSVVLVMVAGFTGAIFGSLIFKIAKIDTAISRGVAMGSASHGIGLTKLKDYGEEDLSVGSLTMGLSAVLGAFLCPLFVVLFM